MGQYILCDAIAEHPYCIRQLGLCLYTAEELCYYIYNNISLIGDDFISPGLLLFLRQEVKQADLADKIERYYNSPADLESMLVLLLRDIGYYTDVETARFQERFSRLRKQNKLEQKRERADMLFERGRMEGAIREYSGILSAKRDTRLKPYFYAQVLQHMGAAYMRLGYSDEALECLEAAYRESPEAFILKQMYFLAMETGRPYPKQLEDVDAASLTEWQQSYLDSQNLHLAEIQTDESQMVYFDRPGEKEKAIRRQLEEEKRLYRSMIGEQA